MAQNPNGNPITAYNDNSIPFGGIGVNAPVHFFRGQSAPTDLGVYLIESITITRPPKEVQRPDQLGGPNGFALVKGQDTASAKVQMAITTTAQLQMGDYFSYTFDATVGTEKYVVKQVSQAYEMNSYWFVNVELIRAYYT